MADRGECQGCANPGWTLGSLVSSQKLEVTSIDPCFQSEALLPAPLFLSPKKSLPILTHHRRSQPRKECSLNVVWTIPEPDTCGRPYQCQPFRGAKGMGRIAQSPTVAGPQRALGLISADDSASNCRGGTVVRMLVRKCLFILKKNPYTHTF